MDQTNNLNPKFISVKEGDSTEKTMIGEITKVGTCQTVWKDGISIGQILGVDPDLTIITEAEALEVMRDSISIGRQNIRREYRNHYRGDDYSRNRGRSRSRERSISRRFNN